MKTYNFKNPLPFLSYSIEKAGLDALVKLLAFVIGSRNWIWINSLFLIIYEFPFKLIGESLEAFFFITGIVFLKKFRK